MYWITGILGFFLMLAPFLFNYTENLGGLWTSFSIGLLVVLASWLEGYERDHDSAEYWAAEILGILAIIAPFVFGFSNHSSATWISVSIGVLLAFFAGTRIWIGPTKQW